MTRQYVGLKRNGSQCTVTINSPQMHCWWHDPANHKRRQKAAAKGGKARAAKVAKDLHKFLEASPGT